MSIFPSPFYSPSLVYYPDKILRAANESINKTQARRSINSLANEMLRIMRENDGVGLAAPQVGANVKMFVTKYNLLPHQIIINPFWLPVENYSKYTVEEGCLSFPNLTLKVLRFDKIHVCYRSKCGKIWAMDIGGYAAQVFQHETDHLDGRLFIDHYISIV
ncbi:peptide deformylase [Candidatus Bathyarchaeota archaeon]|nr:MAG: peptide deformylase [Candidatus Bathyarchaeota archaeon]